MKIRKEARPRTPARPLTLFSIFFFLLAIPFLAAGCGAPGEPLPPSPPIPVAVDDLAAQQSGDAVLLTFTMPGKSTIGQRLTEMPTLEILRGSLKPDGTPDPKSFRVVDTVPGTLVASYIQQGKVQFLDPIPPEETQAHPDETVVYRVRMRVTDKKISPNSNDAVLTLFPVPEKIASLEALVTENGIQLKWQPPGRTSGGGPLGAIQAYHIYRGEVDPPSADAGSKDLRQASWKSPLLQIAVTSAPEYLDFAFDYGKTYIYLVRTAILAGGAPRESSDSSIALVTPKDTFPPAAPQGIVAATLPADSSGSVVVDLSWSINVEPDLAGYRIYRSEQESKRGELLTPDLLPTPSYRDTSVVAGKHYWYTVTAVDQAGNESALSAPIAVEVAQPST
jgi:hypothetical protein